MQKSTIFKQAWPNIRLTNYTAYQQHNTYMQDPILYQKGSFNFIFPYDLICTTKILFAEFECIG